MKRNIYNEKRFANCREIIKNSALKFGRRTAFWIKDARGEDVHITYRRLERAYYALCARLLEKGYGGKKIAVTGKNSFEWTLCYLCASTVGVAVPLDKELHPEDIRDFMVSAECVAVFTEDDKVSSIAPYIDGRAEIISFSEVYAFAEKSFYLPVTSLDTVDGINIGKDSMQVLIFTSGTTGNSKGVCLSQYNICSNIHSTVSIVKIKKTDRTLSILPLHHTYECTLDCLLLLSRGACITYSSGLMNVSQNIREYKPTVLVVVPALLKVISKRISITLAAKSPACYRKYFEKLSLGAALSRLPFIVRKIICKKVKETLGGKIRLFIVGAAELDTSLISDFSALGVRTLQGYGLTECSPLLAGNSDFYFNPESTGVAIPGVQLKINNPDSEGVGEILAKGDNIMLGYYNDKKSTSEVFKDGWFCTGDLGKMGKDGDLYIKGRIKNVIVTSNGKNIYPEELETRLSRYPEIGEVLVVAAKENGETCVKAKILPNWDFLKEKFGFKPSQEEALSRVEKAVMEVNAKVPGYKRIKIIEVLKKALEKTTTQKIKRFGSNMT